MKKYLIKALVFIVGLFCLDRMAFTVLQSQRPSDYAAFLDAKRTFFRKQGRYDMLIFGDSHVADAIDPRTLRLYGMEAYNLGVYHASPYEIYHLAASALRRMKVMPKYVVLGTNPIMFMRKLRIGKYTPLIIRDDFIDYSSLVINSEDGHSIRTLFYSAQEKYLLQYMLKKVIGIKYHPTREIQSINNGHLEFYNQMPGVSWDGGAEEADLSRANPLQIEFFVKTIDFLQNHNIKVLVVNLPLWQEREKKLRGTGGLGEFEQILSRICKEKGVYLVNPNHELATGVLKKEDYLNAEHLNYKGAVKFSHELAVQIDMLPH